jgi:hypothetical protein
MFSWLRSGSRSTVRDAAFAAAASACSWGDLQQDHITVNDSLASHGLSSSSSSGSGMCLGSAPVTAGLCSGEMHSARAAECSAGMMACNQRL